MCQSDKHDYVVAGVGEHELVLVCRHCGDIRTHRVSRDFKVSDFHLSVEEKVF